MQKFIRCSAFRASLQVFTRAAAYGLKSGFLLGLLLGGSHAAALQLGLPVACEMGKTCFIQNYVDHQSGSGYKDYQCGHLTYDRHQGTDFRVIDEHAMAQGVPVLAAAPGRIIGVRDGEPDIAISVRGQGSVAGKEAGNGVVIDHGDEWQTQYSHLRNGSVLVRVGDQVKEGQPIGLIGESGMADFPHVDFTVRKNGQPVDPFWPVNSWACGINDRPAALWRPSISKSVSYIATAILQTGFAERIPSRLEAQTGRWGLNGKIESDTPQLVLWASVMGVNAGDRWRMEVDTPLGQRLFSATGVIEGDKAIMVIGAGKRLDAGRWPQGRYTGVFTLVRDGKSLLTQSARLTID